MSQPGHINNPSNMTGTPQATAAPATNAMAAPAPAQVLQQPRAVRDSPLWLAIMRIALSLLSLTWLSAEWFLLVDHPCTFHCWNVYATIDLVMIMGFGGMLWVLATQWEKFMRLV